MLQRRSALLVTCFAAGLSWSGCEGPRGPVGPRGDAGVPGEGGVSGTMGDAGSVGPTGPMGCAGLAPGATAGLTTTLKLSTPANGSFFVAGERAVVTIGMSNNCGEALTAAQLGTANLYVSGPRLGSITTTSAALLNCITDRAATDDQHHFVNLRAPHYADPSQNNLVTQPDGTLLYTLAPVTSELPGTYTVGVWTKSVDGIDQSFPTLDMQIGNATAEVFASGPSAESTCFSCHLGAQSGKSYQAHILPGYSPFGDYALDATPIATCKLCHNIDGYSVNPIVRKVHGAHRGANQLAPGVAHPEYGLGTDTSLAAYTDVVFPSMPGAELDCAKCHTDNRWKVAAQLSCGTCHDNVFFNTGTLTPPRAFGAPAGGACTTDDQCLVFGDFATCDVAAGSPTKGSCFRRSHPPQSNDAMCATCHPPDGPGLAPVSVVHSILAVAGSPGLQLTNVLLSGGSGPSPVPSTGATGSFVAGADVPKLTFQLNNAAGIITTLKTDATLSATAIISGPTGNRQRVYGPLTISSQASLTFDGTSTYSYTFPSPFPLLAESPYDTTTAPQANVPGTYTAWLYVNQTVSSNGATARVAANSIINFGVVAGPSAAPTAIQPQQVVSDASCNSCHVNVQAHGGSRQTVGSECSMCHTQGAVDLTAGSKGVSCTSNAQCPGAANNPPWESCQDTNGDHVLDACVITVDPTPNRSIDFAVLIHNVHFDRLRAGYTETNYLLPAPTGDYVGYQNVVSSFDHVLFPQDIRNCKTCHQDSASACSATAPCGIGQTCQSGSCVNTAWLLPSTRTCTSCHDDASTAGHAAVNTWIDPTGAAVETCATCHGAGAQFAVDTVHQIAHPYVPPYSRE